jgi:hypothetical protein
MRGLRPQAAAALGKGYLPVAESHNLNPRWAEARLRSREGASVGRLQALRALEPLSARRALGALGACEQIFRTTRLSFQKWSGYEKDPMAAGDGRRGTVVTL